MGHHHLKSGYDRLTERINKFPQGAPPSELFIRILGVLMTESEATLISKLPIRPFYAEKAAKAWHKTESDAEKQLQDFASRAILLDFEQPDGISMYTLPPPMAGFFEFSLMRIREDIDQKLISELFYQYITIEEDFIRDLMAKPLTNVGRIFVQEAVLSEDNSLHVLDYERASNVIKTTSDMGVSMCYCRHKKQHTGTACDAPMDICFTFGGTASSLIKHGHARRVDETEGMKLLEKAYEHHLVQFGENVRNEVSFICNCCGCCCEALTAARRFGLSNPINTTNFLPIVDETACTGCGKCAKVCPVEAMGIVSANDAAQPNRKKAKLDERICLGCGVCVRACPTGAIKLTTREMRVITPVNSAHRAVSMAIEQGQLQHLIFDNQAFMSHRMMAAVLGVILKLPPVKQVMASKQIKSRYLDRLLSGL